MASTARSTCGQSSRTSVAVAREPGVLHDAPDELAVAVVLDRPVDAVAVHAAGHAAVLQLERRVPAQEVAQLVGEAHLRERAPGEHAVADPRAAVAARAGLDARPLAVHEDPGERGAQALLEGARRRAGARSACARGASRQPRSPREPRLAPRGRLRAREAGRRRRRRLEERDRDHDRRPCARRRDAQVERERALGEAERVVNALGAREASLEERREPLL